VWGACRDPGRPLEFSTLGGRRPPLRRRGPDLALHQFVYPDEAQHVFDPGLRVTGPAQTVCDLLRTPGAFEPRRRVAVRLLLPLVAGGADEIRARLVNGRAQYRCVALGRLDAV
jgi:hypothetical protein